MRALLIALLAPLSLPASAQLYDLSPGTVRYHIGCFQACIPENAHHAIETVIGEQVIEGTAYSIVEWQEEIWDEWGAPQLTWHRDTSLVRMEGDRLLVHTASGDSLLFDYGFEQGGTVVSYVEGVPFSVPILLDTTRTFPDGITRRVWWGDSTETWCSFQKPRTCFALPDDQAFVDSSLQQRDGWLVPRWFRIYDSPDSTVWYAPESTRLLFYVEGIGSVHSYFNHRHLALVGYRAPEGTLYGHEVRLFSSAEPPEQPEAFTLEPAGPNPFSARTVIHFSLSAPTPVRLDVFDALGRHVLTLADGLLPASRHRIPFEAGTLPAGAYFYRLAAPHGTAVRPLVLAR